MPASWLKIESAIVCRCSRCETVVVILESSSLEQCLKALVLFKEIHQECLYTPFVKSGKTIIKTSEKSTKN